MKQNTVQNDVTKVFQENVMKNRTLLDLCFNTVIIQFKKLHSIQHLSNMWRPANHSRGHLHVVLKIQLFNPKIIITLRVRERAEMIKKAKRLQQG